MRSRGLFTAQLLVWVIAHEASDTARNTASRAPAGQFFGREKVIAIMPPTELILGFSPNNFITERGSFVA
jgi:hypothetical protein